MTDEARAIFPPMLADALGKSGADLDTLRASLSVLLMAQTNMVQRLDSLARQVESLKVQTTKPARRTWWHRLARWCMMRGS